jgi:hypothetical protein
MASKTKLTPTLQEKICNLLRHGNYVETAARCAGIHRDTFYTWMKKGEEGVEPYAAFNEAVHEALALGEALDLAKIEKAATTNWTAAAWRLERRFPERWGRRDRVKVDVRAPAHRDRTKRRIAITDFG